jgi:hypothetical protein
MSNWPTYGIPEKRRNFDVMRFQEGAGPRYYLGLDLGQSKDFTALVILEKHGTNKSTSEYHARHLQRYELGTSYPTIVADVGKVLRQGVFLAKRPTLAIDGTGVGAPVVDIFKREKLPANLRPILITGGDSVTRENGVTRVPKRDLVGVVQVMLQTGRLKIAAELPEAITLTRELQNFQVKITESANDTYGAWREGTHDDLVLALALALWSGQNDGGTMTVVPFRI